LEIKEIDFVDNIFEKERIIKTQLEMKYIKKAINIINKVYKKIFSEKDLLI
jgi:Xaa-Pro aminopeptidase